MKAESLKVLRGMLADRERQLVLDDGSSWETKMSVSYRGMIDSQAAALREATADCERMDHVLRVGYDDGTGWIETYVGTNEAGDGRAAIDAARKGEKS